MVDNVNIHITRQAYIKKVNRVFTVFFALGSITTLILAMLSISSNYISFLALFISAALSSALIYQKSSEKTIMTVLLIGFLIAGTNLMLDVPEAGVALALVTVCSSAFYFNKWLPLFYGACMGTALFYIQLFVYHNTQKVFVIQMMDFFFATGILFFITKWGNELIQTAGEKEMNTKSVLEELEKTMKVVETSTVSLDSDIDNCNNNLAIVREISNSVAIAIQEITNGVVTQTQSVGKINNLMSKADEKISEITAFSKMLSDVSEITNGVVGEGSQKINQMGEQMEIVNQAVTKSFTTVQDLNENMDEVNNFLSSITQIAQQTNLLALNAAIESARAGESGKGFAVVADEIRKLAEQSSNTVKQINRILNQIKGRTLAVLHDVQKGNEATQVGNDIVSQVSQGFERIHTSFIDINRYIAEEVSKIESTALLFSNIRLESENIASVSEEHAASTEEVMATTEEQNANIETIYNLMREIKKSSDCLATLAAVE